MANQIELQSDDSIQRGRVVRTLFGTTCLTSLTSLPTYILWEIGSDLNFGALGALNGLTIGTFLSVAKLLPHLLVTVPQMQGLVTTNPLKRKGDPNVVYGPGRWAFRFPWEVIGEESNVTLSVITASFEETVPGKNTAHFVKGSFQFRVRLKNAAAFIGIDEGTLRTGVQDIILATISTALADKTLDEAKSDIEVLNRKLKKAVGGDGEGANQVSEVESLYGIDIIAVTITSIDPSEQIQRVRDLEYTTQAVFSAIAQFFGMTRDEFIEALKSGKVTMDQLVAARRDALAAVGVGTLVTTDIRSTGGGRNINLVGTGGH